MLAPFLPTLATLVALLVPASPASGWRPLLAYDEVTVEMDRTTAHDAGPYVVQLRWTYRDRAVSPSAWDAGVRSAIDLVEIDCRARASRTWITTAYGADGRPVPALSAEHAVAAWERHPDGSLGGLLVREGCALLTPAR